MKKEIKNQDFKIARARGSIETDQLQDENTGTVYTQFGIVRVYSCFFKRTSHGYTTLFFIYNGREYYQHTDRFYSARFLVTLSDRFAKDTAMTALGAKLVEVDFKRPWCQY